MTIMTLKAGREKSLLRRHPWIFSGSVAGVRGTPAPGTTVEIVTARGERLGRAAYSPASQILGRVWTFDPDEEVDEAFFARRIAGAIALRRDLRLGAVTDATRLVHAESDGLPGVVVDRYGPTLVLQCLTAGAEAWKGVIAKALAEATGCAEIYERSDPEVRAREDLPPAVGPLRGSPLTALTITEHGLRFRVDVAAGQKTGFFLDQRKNRDRLRAFADGRDVLDCFCYTGGFAVNALAGGARSVLAVDASAAALALVRANAAENGLDQGRLETQESDVFKLLRRFRDEGRDFDLIVLDPPKFAPTAAQAEKASRGYKDINLLAFKLLRPGGLLFTFSCSGGVDAALFQKIVASAALDAGVDALILESLSQAADHPVSVHFPQGAYLKGLVCRKG